MVKWCLLLLVWVLTEIRGSGTFIFPGQLDHAEGDACRTNAGGSGICSRSCEHSSSLGEPLKCGIKDSRFLLCCDAINAGITNQPFTDISAPRVSFQCGKNSKNNFFLDIWENGGDTLRPGAAPHIDQDVVREYIGFPGIPDGLVEAELLLPENQLAAIGGVNASKNAWPWMALLGREDGQGIKWICGGALINEQWILTAAHCLVLDLVEIVRLGEHNYNDDLDFANHEDFDVIERAQYPDYEFVEGYHDLALIKLANKVILKEYISPVCLPWGRESERDITGHQATLTGWGDTEFRGYPSSILQEVNVTVFPPSQCDSGYSNLPHYTSSWPRGIGEEILCAGDPAGGRDACQGDSGGPLVSQDAIGRFQLRGIVSKGYGCGHKEYPGLYVNLRHPPYLAWIKKTAFST